MPVEDGLWSCVQLVSWTQQERSGLEEQVHLNVGSLYKV